jgi:hypothetical protein
MNLKKIFLVITFLAVSIGIFGMNAPIIKAITAEELLAEINRIQAQIAQLQKQLAELQGKPAAWCHNFNTNLKIGDSGLEVEALQTALEKEGFNVGGDTKGNFGENTASAVVSFQEKYKSEILGPWRLEHGTGYVGQTTRAKLNKLYGCGQIVSPPVTAWQKIYGGTGTEIGRSIAQTNDGGYIITGNTSSFGTGNDFDVYLLKTDANGNMLWQKNYGGTGSFWVDDDEGRSVAQTSDGGYIIAGWTRSYGTLNGTIKTEDVYLIKTDSNGNLLWQRTYGGTSFDTSFSVSQTVDGGYIITGETSSYGAGDSDVYLIKTDANGNLIWQKTYGGVKWDRGESILQTKDGNYIIAGGTTSYGAGGIDVYLIKTDANGNLIWQKTYGGSNEDEAASILEDKDGNYLIVGHTYSYGTGMGDVYLIKTDANGNLIWQKTYGGTGSDIGFSVSHTVDSDYIIAGATQDAAGGMDFYIIKTDANGNLLWQKIYGSPGDVEIAHSVAQTNDGGHIIAGEITSFFYGPGHGDVWLIKIAGE